MRLQTIRFRTHYWMPGTNYLSEIVDIIKNRIEEEDILVVSEKALSTASSNLIDESKVEPSSLARFLVDIWTRRFWGGPLGKATKLRDKTLENLRNYPLGEGASHKQIALREVGFLQSLRHYSEGGIDASNLPYAYVCLPLKNPLNVAEELRKAVNNGTGKKVTVVIVDGDTTYSWRNLHLAPRRVSTPGLVHIGGVVVFVFGRVLGFKARQTPVAVSGTRINPDRALWYARLYHKLCGRGAGRTVWSMSANMNTPLTGVTWEMLNSVDHYPLAIFRVIED
jgi:F420-0:gamma-glutamyl ligase-like protein